MAYSSIQQKKKVDGKYNPDTFRVFGEDALFDHPKYHSKPYRSSFEPSTPTFRSLQCNNNADDDENTWPSDIKITRVLPQISANYRANNPQPLYCGFLDKNAKSLMAPICNVYTAPVQHEERYWWPTRANPGELCIPPFTENTQYRSDYNCRHGERPAGAGRHTSHLNREPALGTIPVNYLREADGTQRLFKEDVSFEHIYNCRTDPNYPIRGKRHGAFVWKRMDPISQRKFIEYYDRLEQEELRAMKNEQESPLSKENGIHVIRSTNHKAPSGHSSPNRKLSMSSAI